MKKFKFLTREDAHSFFIDKVTVQFFFLTCGGQSRRTKKLRWNKRNLIQEKVHFLDGTMTISKDDGTCKIVGIKSFSLNKYIRELCCKKYDYPMLNIEIDAGSNVLPAKIRLMLKQDGISIATIRTEAIKWLMQEIQSTQEIFKEYLKEIYGFSQLNKESLSLQYAEIDYDLICDQNLSKNKKILINLQHHAGLTEDFIFGNNPGDKALRHVTSTTNLVSDDKEGINGRNTSTGMLFQSYLKEKSKYGHITRFECKFTSRDVIKKYHSGNSFSSYSELRDLFISLGRATFDFLYPILNETCHYTDENKLELAKEYCRVFYKQHYELAFKELCYGKKCVNTKGISPSPKCLAFKTRLLHRQKVFLKKKGRGVYVLDWNWVLSNSKKFPLENSRE